MQGKLIVIEGKSEGSVSKFAKDQKITIGRNKRCSLTLNDSKTSSMHCQIDVSADSCRLKDLGSTNGSYVNDEKIDSTVLKNGDIISIGNTKIRIEYEVGEDKNREKTVVEITEAWSEDDLPQSFEDHEFIDDYKILRPLDIIDDGENYQAEHSGHKSVVIVRRLPVSGDPEHCAKFLRKAQTYSNFDNPRIIKVLEVTQQNDVPVIVMDYIQGSLLSQWITKKQKVSLSRALKFSAYAASGIGYLHKIGVFGVGLNPRSIIIEDVTKHLKLFDISICKILRDCGYDHSHFKQKKQHFHRQDFEDDHNDIYSLGALLFFLLSGGTPPNEDILQGEKSYAQWIAKTRKIPKDITELLQQTLDSKTQQDTPSIKEFYKRVTATLNNIKKDR